MKTQSYSNHRRVHAIYHYFLVPTSLILVLAGIAALYYRFGLISTILFLAMVVLHMVIFLLRDYAKKNQDRTIRLELRLRYFQLTGQRFENVEQQLSLDQLLALRFTRDDEFMQMLNAKETKSKTPDQIKKEILHWNPDWMRV